MHQSDLISLLNILATVIAVIAAPIIALRVNEKLQEKSNTRQQKVQLLGVLLSLRHQPLAPENFKALNSIDSAFIDSPRVRDAWTRYLAALNDGQLTNDPGYAIREQKRTDLLMEIIHDLGLQNKISTADILRTYTPSVITEIEHLAIWERIKRRNDLRTEFIQKGIGFPDYVPPYYPSMSKAPSGVQNSMFPPPPEDGSKP